MRAHALAPLQVAAAALLFSLGGAGIKACELTSWQVASFRSGVAAIVLWILMPEARRRPTPRTLLVALGYASTMILFVLANKLTTSANTIFLQATAPLYIVLLAPWLLRERARAYDFGVMALVLAGLALFFVGAEPPVRTAPDPTRGDMLAALSGLTWAFTIIGVRWIARGEREGLGPAASAVVIGNVLASALALPWALPVEAARATDLALVAGLGVVQIGFAYMFLVRGIRHVPALEVSLILLLEPALNPVWAWLVHGERPGIAPMVGGALILLATILKSGLDARRLGTRVV